MEFGVVRADSMEENKMPAIWRGEGEGGRWNILQDLSMVQYHILFAYCNYREDRDREHAEVMARTLEEEEKSIRER